MSLVNLVKEISRSCLEIGDRFDVGSNIRVFLLTLGSASNVLFLQMQDALAPHIPTPSGLKTMYSIGLNIIRNTVR